MQKSGVGIKQKVINQLKWKTAANYNTGTNRESWMSGKGEVKRIFFFKAVSHWLKSTLNVGWTLVLQNSKCPMDTDHKGVRA